jgi:uncharacterized protein (TIGR03437 family)
MIRRKNPAFSASVLCSARPSDSRLVAIRVRALLLAVAVLLAPYSGIAAGFSTFFQENCTIQALGHDTAGNLYVLGLSENSPVPSRTTSLFVAKLNSSATQLAFFVYLGGSANDQGTAMAVDSSGNAYVTGDTDSPDFPITSGPAPALTQPSPFLMKLSPAGAVLNSTLFAGQVSGSPAAIAVDSGGNAYITGTATGSGFPSTGGAYTARNSQDQPFVAKVDPTGSKLLFSAIGVGGSFVVLGATGDIFVAGNTINASYPTTAGAIQSSFTPSSTCGDFGCSANAEQYVTRLSANGATLIYSTFLTGSDGATNAGLVVDNTGNAYVTGVTNSTDYPFTAAQQERLGMFLTKIDPTGAKILWSEQQGGNLLAMDNSGNLAVAGNFFTPSGPPFQLAFTNPPFPPTGSVPTQCLPNGITVQSDGYSQRFSSVDGSLLATQILAATWVTASAITVNANGVIVVAGYTNLPDVPLTPGVVFTSAITQRIVPGSYLAGFDFSTAAAATQVSCTLDAATMLPVGPVAPGQLLSLMGYGLGPQVGVAGSGATQIPTTLSGVQVAFGGVPAPLLYVSSGQINIQVPFEVGQMPFETGQSTVMTVSVASATGGATATTTQEFALAASNPSVFVNSSTLTPTCGQAALGPTFEAVALNSDGTLNTCANPAKAGSSVTVFLNGLNAFLGSYGTGSIVGPGVSPLGYPVLVSTDTSSFFPLTAGPVSLAAGPLYLSPGSIDAVDQLSVQMPAVSSAGVAAVGLIVAVNTLAVVDDGLFIGAGPYTILSQGPIGNYAPFLLQAPSVVWVVN